MGNDVYMRACMPFGNTETGGEKRVQSLLSLVGGQQKLPKTEIWRCKIVSMLNLEMRSMLSENNEF